MNLGKAVFITLMIFLTLNAKTQSDSTYQKNEIEVKTQNNHWTEKIKIRGYAQVRNSQLLETNPNLQCEQCDKSWGGTGGFFIRRARVVFYGNLAENIFFYIQPDFASAAGTDKLHFAQMRDIYLDLGIDKKNVFRFRIGQSKVPYGFENMQSSQNRLTLDRNDPLNSAVANERDLGIFFYWTPIERQKILKSIMTQGLKGSGNYGVFGFGAYNGQTANQPEKNDDPHYVARFTWPFMIKSQILETSLQAYTGKYAISTSNLSPGVKHNFNLNYLDQRIAGSLIIYPQPLGFQAEYNIGQGPEFNPATDSIETQNLKGGYAQMMYFIKIKKQILIPFIKYQYYDGGKKHEKDARSYTVNDLEFGLEWQLNKHFELVSIFTISKRRFEDFSKQNNYQEGSLLRLQAQFNF